MAIGLLEAEKGLTRRSDELARRRRELPWVRVEKDYRFATEDGDALLRDLFGGRSQLLVYHFMFDPDSRVAAELAVVLSAGRGDGVAVCDGGWR